MTRFAIDALTAIRIVREGTVVPEENQLVAPKSLQTQALSQLYRDVRAGSLGEDEAREILDGITTMRIRLLGDRVSRGTAWRIAAQLDWDDTTNAEYIARSRNCRPTPLSLSTSSSRGRSRGSLLRRRLRHSSKLARSARFRHGAPAI